MERRSYKTKVLTIVEDGNDENHERWETELPEHIE